MIFDPWTFFFQLVNFAVLLFVLKRLLYRPVREIMEKRRAVAANALAEAERIRQEASRLKEEQLAELEGLKRERMRLDEEMKGEVEKERRELLGEAALEAKRLTEKERVLFEAEKKRYGVELKEAAVASAGLFAHTLCRDLADEELHRALFRRLLREVAPVISRLQVLPRREGELKVEAVSAYPLTEQELNSLRELLASGAGRGVALLGALDPELLAGVRLRCEDLVFDASLSGQVASLTERLKREP